ncbi:MAG: class I SAM-dependent methyltransferase, partial [Candidatus Krumholzibacteriia bacterium]
LAAALPAVLLPSRHEPLLILADSAAAALAARGFLRGRSRLHADACLFDAAALARLPAGQVTTGPGATGLWRPPPFLSEQAALLPPPAAGPVLDLGAGSGRASVWLAARGYAVTAIDHLPDALDLARDLIRAEGVDPARITLLARDLCDPDAVPPGPLAAALSFRYLERPLLRSLAGRLQPGGVAMVRTFRRAGARTAAMRQHFLLAPGELPLLFPDPPYETLVHREDDDPDGRPAAGIVARLRG